MQLLFDPRHSAVCTVTELSRQIGDLLGSAFPSVTVLGEIAELTRAASGHHYFCLKDANASIRAILWASKAMNLGFVVKDGLEVIVYGRVATWGPRSQYQIQVEAIEPRGLGRQDLALRMLKEKLQKLGYFAGERKKPLPRFPRRIALVTSPRSAAVRDMLEVLGRRWQVAEVLVCPVRVQGEEAPHEIATMLALLPRMRRIDVIILGRGGGSSEDLRAFNDERVARAIFQSPLPIISAVGHEIDVTIADLVADFRALTPSEAAERATPDRADLAKQFIAARERLDSLLLGQLRAARQRLDHLRERPVLRRPTERHQELRRRLDEIEERMQLAWRRRMERGDQRLRAFASQLQSLSPLNVLARGYSLTRAPDGRLIRSVGQVEPGQTIEVRLADGELRATVLEAHSKPT